jgi:glycosyltransferase involved in cell wall biosynthesis
MGLTVSVVITCHNYGRYLRECLESILAQERPADEILVVDDASTDESPAIVAEYADHGVRYERVEFRDACRSYNHGIAASSGDLIAYVDADNSLTPRFISTLAARLEADPDLAFAYSDRYWSGEGDVAAWQVVGAVPGRVGAGVHPPPPR